MTLEQIESRLEALTIVVKKLWELQELATHIKKEEIFTDVVQRVKSNI